MTPGPALLVARRSHATRKKLKRRFFDIKQKKGTRRKAINASQLAIRKFNDIIGKDMKTPCVFIFT